MKTIIIKIDIPEDKFSDDLVRKIDVNFSLLTNEIFEGNYFQYSVKLKEKK